MAVLDVDLHHGNGTQGGGYTRADVLTVSLHAHPERLYPFLRGYADERGAGVGEGANLNLPPERGSGDAGFLAALGRACAAIGRWGGQYTGAGAWPRCFRGRSVCRVDGDDSGIWPDRGNGGVARPAEVVVREGGYLCPELGANLAEVPIAWA